MRRLPGGCFAGTWPVSVARRGAGLRSARPLRTPPSQSAQGAAVGSFRQEPLRSCQAVFILFTQVTWPTTFPYFKLSLLGQKNGFDEEKCLRKVTQEWF